MWYDYNNNKYKGEKIMNYTISKTYYQSLIFALSAKSGRKVLKWATTKNVIEYLNATSGIKNGVSKLTINE